MPTIAKRVLSGSMDGFPINVSATAVSATLIHTGSTSTSVIDEVWLYLNNSSTTTVTAWIEFGGASSSGLMTVDVLPKGNGPSLVLPGLPIQGRSATGADLRIGASTSNVLSVYGFVNRISQ